MAVNQEHILNALQRKAMLGLVEKLFYHDARSFVWRTKGDVAEEVLQRIMDEVIKGR